MEHGLEYRKGCKQRDHTGGCCSHPEKGWNTNLRYNSEGKSIRIGDYLDIRSKSGASQVALEVSEVNSLSRVWLFATLWTVAYQAPQSMEIFRQEYWSELPFPSPGDLLDPGIEPRSPALQADALPSEPPGKPSSGKEPANAGDLRDVGLIPGLGRSPGGGHGNPLQYSCLGNPMYRGAWRAIVHRAAKSQTWLKWVNMHARSKSKIQKDVRTILWIWFEQLCGQLVIYWERRLGR